jgi:predicted nucleic acid-binding Zn ribbon protein
MPTYEFRCPDGSIIEARFKISEVPESIPTPDGTGVATRIISGGASLLFKGSGFYITDYGKDGKKDQRTGGASAAEGGSSSDSKSDTSSSAKPAASAPSASSSSTSSSE